MMVKTVEIVEKLRRHPRPGRAGRACRHQAGTADRLGTLLSQVDSAQRQDGRERTVPG